MKKLFIYSNTTEQSLSSSNAAKYILSSKGFEIAPAFSKDVDLILVFGGDGAFLNALEKCDYPDTPVLGVNTGHLGFFQELDPTDSEGLLEYCSSEGYKIQPYRLLKVTVIREGLEKTHYALNDVIIRNRDAKVVHLKLSVGDNFVEKFYGDGIIIASSAGSTGYNYSLGGCIVDPRLEVLQLTPFAPINNQVFRSFTSSLLFPSSQEIKISPLGDPDENSGVYCDGEVFCTGKADTVTVSLSERVINIVRSLDYDFWNKVQSKFL